MQPVNDEGAEEMLRVCKGVWYMSTGLRADLNSICGNGKHWEEIISLSLSREQTQSVIFQATL